MSFAPVSSLHILVIFTACYLHSSSLPLSHISVSGYTTAGSTKLQAFSFQITSQAWTMVLSKIHTLFDCHIYATFFIPGEKDPGTHWRGG